jgi:hypothetical protein
MPLNLFIRLDWIDDTADVAIDAAPELLVPDVVIWAVV